VSAPDERFLVVTEHGRVLVIVRGEKDGLDPDLIEVVGDADAADVRLETPLRAFAAKMVDLVQARGAGAATMSPAMAALMIKEKAAEDLKRIERAARRLHEQGRGDAGP
jgi:hypothetical protein